MADPQVSNVYDIDHKRRRVEQRTVEASIWIAKMDRGLDDAEADALRAWMRADPENQAELLEMARMWDKMDALARLSEVFPHPSEAGPSATRGGCWPSTAECESARTSRARRLARR